MTPTDAKVARRRSSPEPAAERPTQLEGTRAALAIWIAAAATGRLMLAGHIAPGGRRTFKDLCDLTGWRKSGPTYEHFRTAVPPSERWVNERLSNGTLRHLRHSVVLVHRQNAEAIECEADNASGHPA